MDDTAQKICHAHNPTSDKLDKFVKNVIFNRVDKKYIMDDTAHCSVQKICHTHNPRLDKLDKFVKMSFSTENISWMILRTALHRKYVTLITLHWTNWTNL